MHGCEPIRTDIDFLKVRNEVVRVTGPRITDFIFDSSLRGPACRTPIHAGPLLLNSTL